MLHFQFDANLPHQLDAIQSVVDLFVGQPASATTIVDTTADSLITAVPNHLLLDDATLLDNLHQVQQRNGLALSPELYSLEGSIERSGGTGTVRFPNYSIEMETGTGKTYVYLRTIMELHKHYGQRKFIIVVPSVAVREGVLTSLQMTEHHLLSEYSNPAYNYFAYNADNLARIRNFATSPGIEIMVMTLAAFNKSSNVINRDDLDQMERPIWHLQGTRPILILDEPQNMESELSKQALASLDPLFALRYSATHRDYYNRVYRVTPFQAYRDGLVKKIEVASVVRDTDANRPYLRLLDVQATSKRVDARIEAYKRLVGGKIKTDTVKVTNGDKLETKTNNPLYADYVVDQVDRGYGSAGGSRVMFTNGVQLGDNEPLGADRDALMERQVRYAVQEHFRKQAAYKSKQIKVLTLFFIDRVANYADDNGSIRHMFVRAFNDLKSSYVDWQHVDVNTVHNGYFAARRKGGQTEYLDTTGDTKEDNDAYTLIMRDKQRLLSWDEPTAFVFSHSALREGWDNPNVFQICTLNQTTSDPKKRQEIGRGMRLAVDQTGQRVREADYNVLTVVANESYESYVTSLQQEIEATYGKDEAEKIKPADANKRAQTFGTRRDALFHSPMFSELWQRISRKTRYTVTIDTEKLVSDVLNKLEQEDIRAVQTKVSRARVEVGTIDQLATVVVSSPSREDLGVTYELPNLVALVSDLLEVSNPPMLLTRRTLARLYTEASVNVQRMAHSNPYEWAATAARLIKQNLAQQLVFGVQYTPIDEWYQQTLIEPQISVGARYAPSPSSDGVGHGQGMYDKAPCDSDVEVRFADKLEHNACVRLYIKLPAAFKIATPIGNYNPDWAIVMDAHDGHGSTGATLYLVRETKSTTDPQELPNEEHWKVWCGAQHFRAALGVDYRVVTHQSDLPDDGWTGNITQAQP